MPPSKSKRATKNAGGPKKKNRNRSAKHLPEATRWDRHVLYQSAVQCVESEIDFVDETFEKIRGRKASLLREDFAGTANTSSEWVRRRPTNRAVAVDLCADTLAWGLMDRDIEMLRIGQPTSDELAEGFRILTDVEPLPRDG